MRHRRGFSLVECMVAAVILAAGLLAIVASERAMQRLELLGRRTGEAAEAADGRLARLRATACAGAVTGGVTGSIDETWSLSGSGPTRAATITVAFTHDARIRIARYEARFQCAPAP